MEQKVYFPGNTKHDFAMEGCRSCTYYKITLGDGFLLCSRLGPVDGRQVCKDFTINEAVVQNRVRILSHKTCAECQSFFLSEEPEKGKGICRRFSERKFDGRGKNACSLFEEKQPEC